MYVNLLAGKDKTGLNESESCNGKTADGLVVNIKFEMRLVTGKVA